LVPGTALIIGRSGTTGVTTIHPAETLDIPNPATAVTAPTSASVTRNRCRRAALTVETTATAIMPAHAQSSMASHLGESDGGPVVHEVLTPNPIITMTTNAIPTTANTSARPTIGAVAGASVCSVRLVPISLAQPIPAVTMAEPG
jgi:hypothetical protein